MCFFRLGTNTRTIQLDISTQYHSPIQYSTYIHIHNTLVHKITHPTWYFIARKDQVLLCHSSIEGCTRVESLCLLDTTGEELHFRKVFGCELICSVPHAVDLLLEVLLNVRILSKAIQDEKLSVRRLKEKIVPVKLLQ